MKRVALNTDRLFKLAIRGNLHIWKKVNDTRLPTLIRMFDDVGAYGQLEACRYSHADDVYWCRYRFLGSDVRESLGPGNWTAEETGWYTVEPLASGERARW